MEKFNRFSILIAIISYFFVATSCNQIFGDSDPKIEEEIIGHWVVYKKEEQSYGFSCNEVFFYKDKTIQWINEFNNKVNGSYKYFSKFDVDHIELKLEYEGSETTYQDPKIIIKGDTMILEGEDEYPEYKYKFIRKY